MSVTVLLSGKDGMNHNRIEGEWLEVRQLVKAQWGQLTEQDLDIIDGRRDELLARIQQRHGVSQSEAETQLNFWHDRNPTGFFERY